MDHSKLMLPCTFSNLETILESDKVVERCSILYREQSGSVWSCSYWCRGCLCSFLYFLYKNGILKVLFSVFVDLVKDAAGCGYGSALLYGPGGVRVVKLFFFVLRIFFV